MEERVRAAQKGDKASFEWLIHECEKSLYRISRSILGSDEECADAVQETILKAYQSLYKLREAKYFKTWLIRILVNECNTIHRRNRKNTPLQYVQEPESLMNEEALEVRRAVAELDNDLRTLVILYYFEDLPLKDIAKILGLSVGTLKSRLHRARTKLADYLEIADERSANYEERLV